MQNFRVKKGLGIGFDITDHLLNQMLGFGASGSDKNAVAPADMAKYRS
jgi:hypothetical protein